MSISKKTLFEVGDIIEIPDIYHEDRFIRALIVFTIPCYEYTCHKVILSKFDILKTDEPDKDVGCLVSVDFPEIATIIDKDLDPGTKKVGHVDLSPLVYYSLAKKCEKEERKDTEGLTVFIAPNEPEEDSSKATKIFLAGSITGCYNWQGICMNELKKLNTYDDVWLFSPRALNFNMDDPLASYNQIQWEFRYLEQMDIFSMYFAKNKIAGASSPIALYELGRHICRMQTRFPTDWDKRIIISVEDGYSRKEDVILQTNLAGGGMINCKHENVTPKTHAKRIMDAVRYVKTWGAGR